MFQFVVTESVIERGVRGHHGHGSLPDCSVPSQFGGLSGGVKFSHAVFFSF